MADPCEGHSGGQGVPHCCGHDHSAPSVCQTLEELDFERGIWYAALHNDIPRVEKLLKQGVSPDKQDAAGYCALHYAAREGHLEMCRVLFGAGASANLLTKAGRATALHRSASRGHKEIVEFLIENGAAPELQDADGKTALHRAVEAGHYSIAHFLLGLCKNLKYISDMKEKLPIEYAGEDEKLYNLLL